MKLNRDTIKYIAIILMIMDHIIQVFMPRGTFIYQLLDSLSHFTFVTLSYFLVEGYYYTRSKKDYLKRLLLFAVISQLPYHLTFAGKDLLHFIGFNILFTLSFCFIMIWLIDSTNNIFLKALVLIISIAICAFCDWTVYGPIITFAFYLAHGSKKKNILAYIFIILTFGSIRSLDSIILGGPKEFIINILLNCSGIILSAICTLLLYDGTKMKGFKKFNKWFFYIIYPLHLLIIGLINYFIIF